MRTVLTSTSDQRVYLKFLGGRHGKFNWSLDFLRRLQEPICLGVFNVEL